MFPRKLPSNVSLERKVLFKAFCPFLFVLPGTEGGDALCTPLSCVAPLPPFQPPHLSGRSRVLNDGWLWDFLKLPFFKHRPPTLKVNGWAPPQDMDT